MKVILLQDVKSLGKKGEIVNVNDGYARNYILPKKVGVEANGKNLNDLKLQKGNEAKVAKEHLEAAKKLAEELQAGQVELTIKVAARSSLEMEPCLSLLGRKEGDLWSRGWERVFGTGISCCIWYNIFIANGEGIGGAIGCCRGSTLA